MEDKKQYKHAEGHPNSRKTAWALGKTQENVEIMSWMPASYFGIAFYAFLALLKQVKKGITTGPVGIEQFSTVTNEEGEGIGEK